jgi:hypothetical protein
MDPLRYDHSAQGTPQKIGSWSGRNVKVARLEIITWFQQRHFDTVAMELFADFLLKRPVIL